MLLVIAKHETWLGQELGRSWAEVKPSNMGLYQVKPTHTKDHLGHTLTSTNILLS